MGKVDPDFMPELTAEDPDFMEKFAAANGIKFVDGTKRLLMEQKECRWKKRANKLDLRLCSARIQMVQDLGPVLSPGQGPVLGLGKGPVLGPSLGLGSCPCLGLGLGPGLGLGLGPGINLE